MTSVNPSEIFIRRPIATSLLMLALALFGVVAYRLLPVADLPSVEFPTISVNANLPGADPATMASAVASPLERQFTTIAGLDSMTSSSTTGGANITMQFDLNRNIDGAAIDVQTAISAVMPLLPAGMSSPPSFRKVNPADQPVMQFGVISPTLQPSEINFYNESLLAPQMSMVNGVAQINSNNNWRYAVRVQVDPEKLQAYQHRHQRGRSGAAELERQPPDGSTVRTIRDVQHFGRGTAVERGTVPSCCRRLSPRGARAARADCQRHRQRRGHARHRVVLHKGKRPARALDEHQRDAPAGQQPRGGHRRAPPPDAGLSVAASSLGPSDRPRRPFDEHPQDLQGHPVDDAAHAGAGRGRHLRLPPQRLGDPHPGARPAVFAARRLRGDEDAELHASTTCR